MHLKVVVRQGRRKATDRRTRASMPRKQEKGHAPMLSHEKLVDLYRELRDRDVLSVYLDADQRDPADRKVWRKRLTREVSAQRDALADDEDGDLEAFERALALLEEKLDPHDAFLPGAGWVGFATPDRVWYAESIPVPVPDVVRWERGIRVAPYVRGLKQERPVILVLLDSRRARVFRYRNGKVAEIRDLRADTFLGDLSDVGTQKRPTHRSGIRGKTSTDAAQTFLGVGSERMLKELMEKVVTEEAADDALVVIGGIPEAVSAAAQRAPKALAERVVERPSLHVEMGEPEIREAAEEAASQATRDRQWEILEDVVNQAKAEGRACLGIEETERALLEQRVGELLLSRNFVLQSPDFADHCVGAAFEQGADALELSGPAAERLDEEGGVAARLRYRSSTQEAGDASGEAAGQEATEGVA